MAGISLWGRRRCGQDCSLTLFPFCKMKKEITSVVTANLLFLPFNAAQPGLPDDYFSNIPMVFGADFECIYPRFKGTDVHGNECTGLFWGFPHLSLFRAPAHLDWNSNRALASFRACVCAFQFPASHPAALSGYADRKLWVLDCLARDPVQGWLRS